jgi:RimJ/RimL family protein N-acetyltransferase
MDLEAFPQVSSWKTVACRPVRRPVLHRSSCWRPLRRRHRIIASGQSRSPGHAAPLLHGAVFLLPDCPARGHRVYQEDGSRARHPRHGLRHQSRGVGRRVNVTSIKPEMMAEEDVELRVRLETDPQMMAELGGPRPREAIERAHAKSLALAAAGRCWPLKVIPDGGSSPSGGVDVFESSHDDEAIYEIGWMILPEFQNRGMASQAVWEVLERGAGRAEVRADPRLSRSHERLFQQDL